MSEDKMNLTVRFVGGKELAFHVAPDVGNKMNAVSRIQKLLEAKQLFVETKGSLCVVPFNTWRTSR